MSFVTIILVTAYAGIMLDRWLNFKNIDFVSNTILTDMSEDLEMPARENRFQFGFAWVNIRSWQTVKPDQRIAIPQMRSVGMQIAPYI